MDPYSTNSSGGTNDLNRNFSFPNADQYGTDTINPSRTTNPASTLGQPVDFERKRTINLAEALQAEKSRGESAPQNIHTYQSDIANAIKNDNVSMIKIALAEKKRNEGKPGFDSVLEQENKVSRYYIAAGIVGVFVILGLLSVYLYVKNKESNEQAVEIAKAKVPALLYTESESTIDTTDKDPYEIFREILVEKNGIMDLGTMKAMIPTISAGTTTVALTTSDFFTVINARTPDLLVRALESNFLLGVYSYNNPRDVFAIFKVNSYDPAFAGMLEWETNIPSDVGELFINKKTTTNVKDAIMGTSSDQKVTGSEDFNPLEALLGTNNSNTSTSTEETPAAIPDEPKRETVSFINSDKFIDKVVENKDARVLTSSNGEAKMLYTFLDKRTLVIATSDKVLKEIIFRLTTGRISR